jgi:hypothetical protein
MAFVKALELLQTQINEEEEKLGKYCRRCSYEGKKVLMHTAIVQWTDKDHKKHSTPILRVCPNCRNVRWLPNQFERAKFQGGFMREDTFIDDNGVEKKHYGISKLEVADLMQELSIIRQRLYLIKMAFQQNSMDISGGPFDWKQLMKAYFDKI